MKHSKATTILAFKALAEPRRIEILRVLKGGPHPVGEIATKINVTQQAASQHLAILSDAGLVEARREGVKHLYSIKHEGFAPVASFVEGFWGSRLSALKYAIEKKK